MLSSSTVTNGQNQDPIVLGLNQNGIHSFPTDIKNVNFSLSINPLMTSIQTISDPRLEIKERVTVDSQILKVLLSNQKDTITIEIPNSAPVILQPEPMADAPFTLDNKNSVEDEIFTSVISIADKKMALSAVSDDENLSLTLKPSDLFSLQLDNGQKAIPAVISNQGGLEKHSFINASNLMSLLKEYPDPILVEISDINNVISTPSRAKSNQSLSTEKTGFVFDLRDLIKAQDQNSKTQINGVLKSSNRPAVSSAVKDINPSENVAQLQPEYTTANIIQTAESLDPLPQSKSHANNKANIKNDEPNINNNTTNLTSSEEAESISPPKPKDYIQSDRTPNAGKANLDDILPTIEKSFIQNDSRPQPAADMQSITEMMSASIEDIRSAVAAAINKQMSSVKIRLQPESLGSVNVKITWKNNDLSIGLMTENKDTAALLNSNLAELKVGLESANLKIRDINVTIDDSHQNGNSNSGQNLSNGSHGNARHEHKNTDIYESAHGAPFLQSPIKVMYPNLSSIINSHGWIDLKA